MTMFDISNIGTPLIITLADVRQYVRIDVEGTYLGCTRCNVLFVAHGVEDGRSVTFSNVKKITRSEAGAVYDGVDDSRSGMTASLLATYDKAEQGINLGWTKISP